MAAHVSDNNKTKYVVITGATSGFGYEFSKIFARNGFSLVLIARSGERLKELADEITREFMVDVIPLAKDLFKASAAEEVYAELKSKNIPVHVLVNDAGQGEHGNFLEYDISRDMDMIQLNVTSLVCLTKLFLKDMVARNEGKILQIASILGKYPTPLMSVYAATKAFVVAFSEGLIQELKETNVSITVLMPGASDTDFFHKASGDESKTYREEKLSDPAKVAQDGFDALMNGDSRMVSGFKNKLFSAMSAVLPDSTLAKSMHKQMKPSQDPDGREDITHAPSKEERDRIERSTGQEHGDYQSHEDHIHRNE